MKLWNQAYEPEPKFSLPQLKPRLKLVEIDAGIPEKKSSVRQEGWLKTAKEVGQRFRSWQCVKNVLTLTRELFVSG